MSHHRALKPNWLTAGVLALLLVSLESLSYGNRCLPPSPSPCAADGVCRPNRDSWGHYKTRWRSWPGEPQSQQPTTADDTDQGEKEQGLKPYEPPVPVEEDLRGPAKDKAAKKDRDKAAEGNEDGPAGEFIPELPGPAAVPGPEALPAVEEDPFSDNSLEAPAREDAPPALPPSLRQAARALNMPRLTIRQQRPAALPTTQSTTLAVAAQPIRPVSWQQPAVGLVNPASAIVTEPEANTLQQAIYYEASDLDDEPAVRVAE